MSKGAEVEAFIPRSGFTSCRPMAWWFGLMAGDWEILRRFGTSWGILGHLGTSWDVGVWRVAILLCCQKLILFLNFWSELVKTGNLYLMHQKPCSSYAGKKKTVIWVICNLPWLIFDLLMGCVCCIACFQSLPAIKHGNGASENTLQYSKFPPFVSKRDGFRSPLRQRKECLPAMANRTTCPPSRAIDRTSAYWCRFYGYGCLWNQSIGVYFCEKHRKDPQSVKKTVTPLHTYNII